MLIDFRRESSASGCSSCREENGRILYKAFGTSILQINDGFVVDYNPQFRFTEDSKERFISYYESVISKSLEKSQKAEKALSSRKERKSTNPNPSEPKLAHAALEQVEHGFNDSLDFWNDKPLWMTVAFGLPSMVVSFLTSAIAILCLIPVGISEMALRDTVDNLREADFDCKFVADAQRQILEVKLVDLIWQEQIKDLKKMFSEGGLEGTNEVLRDKK